MYSLVLPPKLVARFYTLRERHQLGPIRKQILIACEHYLSEMEAEYGVSTDPSGPAPGAPDRTGRPGGASHG